MDYGLGCCHEQGEHVQRRHGRDDIGQGAPQFAGVAEGQGLHACASCWLALVPGLQEYGREPDHAAEVQDLGAGEQSRVRCA